MNEGFEYGLLARSLFVCLLWLTAVIGFVAPNLLPWQIGLLLFLGIGLKPLLIRTGLHARWLHFLFRVDEARHAEFDAEAGREVERKRRDDRYRKARRLSKELPPNW